MHQNTYRKGFTLVELIVVIAIIAILATVSIVGFTTYIENARMSNDNSAAAQMTNILSAHFITNDDENLEAHDVREIIEEINGGPIDWTPQSSNAGFFYIPEDRKIIAAKFEDIIEPGFVLSTSGETRLLSGTNLAVSTGEPGNTPEEFFSEGAHLLTVSGNVVADVVTGIRALTSSNDVESDYGDLVASAESATTGLSGIFGGNRNVKDIVDDFLLAYSPATTLYVNNTRWLLTNDQNSTSNPIATTIQAQRIVYKPGITTIPSYPNTGAFINIDRIFIPNSVQTIQNNAFGKVVNLNTEIIVSSTLSARVDASAFHPQMMTQIISMSTMTLGTNLTQLEELTILDDGNPLHIDYGDESVVLSGGPVTVQLSSIPGNVLSVMTDLSFINRNGDYQVFFFSQEGIIAEFSFSAKEFLVKFDPNTEDSVTDLPDTTVVNSGGNVSLSSNPTRNGYTFSGWALTPAGDVLILDETPITRNIILYAVWTAN